MGEELVKNDYVDYVSRAPRAPDGALDLNALLPGTGPLEIDIGFGRGMSLFARHERSPESRILGIEIKAKWATLVEERRARLGLANVSVWSGDARELLTRMGPAGAVQRVFVHFPDPWWKKKHTKRRVLGEGVLGDLGRVLAPGGELYVQTDVEDRAQDYLALIRNDSRFAVANPESGFIDHNPFGSISNREKRAEEDGLPVWRILAVRQPG